MQETKKFARKISKKIRQGQVIALNGDLGSGKTTFSQGFAKGLGIDQHVGSPTFKLVITSLEKILFNIMLKINKLKPKCDIFWDKFI